MKIKKLIAGGLTALTLTMGIGFSQANAASLNGVSVNATSSQSNRIAVENDNAYSVTMEIDPIIASGNWEAGNLTITLQPHQKFYYYVEVPTYDYKLQVHTIGHTYSGSKDLGTFIEDPKVAEK